MFDWHKAKPHIKYQCPWCGLDNRQGRHGDQIDRKDGGVNIVCTVVMEVWHPAKVAHIREVE